MCIGAYVSFTEHFVDSATVLLKPLTAALAPFFYMHNPGGCGFLWSVPFFFYRHINIFLILFFVEK